MLPSLKKSDGDASRAPQPAGGATTPLGVRPAAPLRGGTGAPSLIGSDLLITGNLYSKGEVQVDGEVQGDIHSTHVIVGENARVTGGVVGEEVVVRGHVAGSVRGKRVLLQTSSHVEGDIYHQTLAIEQGAFFEGKSRRTDDPIAGLVRPDQRSAESSSPPPVPGSPPVDQG